MLDTIYAEAERMERLVTNLLDMTRVESGGLQLKCEWHPLAEVVGSALHHLKRRLGGRRVENRLQHNLPLVFIDGVAIEQVLVNLIDNAIEYTPANSPIEVSAGVIEDGVAVEVADRGPGLAAGTEQRVFEKFFRAHRSDSRRGLGLGLAIARSMVEAHGGTIAAFNRPGGGAIFRFTLPQSHKPPEIRPEDDPTGELAGSR
jgi:two-component system sensor histidine kinase KdpD